MADARYEWESALISTVTLVVAGAIFAITGWFFATHDWGRMPGIGDVSRLYFAIAYLFWGLAGLSFVWDTTKYLRARKEQDNG